MKTVVINKWRWSKSPIEIKFWFFEDYKHTKTRIYTDVTQSSIDRLMQILKNKPTWVSVTNDSISLFYEAL